MVIVCHLVTQSVKAPRVLACFDRECSLIGVPSLDSQLQFTEYILNAKSTLKSYPSVIPLRMLLYVAQVTVCIDLFIAMWHRSMYKLFRLLLYTLHR